MRLEIGWVLLAGLMTVLLVAMAASGQADFNECADIKGELECFRAIH